MYTFVIMSHRNGARQHKSHGIQEATHGICFRYLARRDFDLQNTTEIAVCDFHPTRTFYGS